MKSTYSGLLSSGGTVILFWLVTISVVLLAGCSSQVTLKIRDEPLSLTGRELRLGGIAFITPSTVTGQEEEKQAVAFIFADVLKRQRPDLNINTLSQTLSLINGAGLTEEYNNMYREYRDTGIFSRPTLERISKVTGARYLAQLKLAGFKQQSNDRFGIFGLRMIETKSADIRLFLQLWDGQSGAIAWESIQELSWAEDKFSEEPITLQTILERSAQEIGERLPH